MAAFHTFISSLSPDDFVSNVQKAKTLEALTKEGTPAGVPSSYIRR